MIYFVIIWEVMCSFSLDCNPCDQIKFSKQSAFDEGYVWLEAFSRKQNETRGETADVHVFMVASDHPATAGRGRAGVSRSD